MPAKHAVQASWYDYPQYFDMAFRDQTRQEADFIEAACRKYGCGSVRRLLEPGCGTGRLVAELAARGYQVSGLDLSAASLAYLRRRLARRGLRAAVIRADMADFRLPRRVDAAYSTANTFRHLLSEAAARRHLECVARCLRPGGIYVLGFHLLPPDAPEECTERWTARHGRTRLSVTLRVLKTERRRRLETLRVSLLVRGGRREFRLRDDFRFRMYTAGQFRRLLARVPCLELCDVYDFWYDIHQPLVLDDEISDTVFVLRKRGGRIRGRVGPGCRRRL
jgi:SAM-dependent methyltransferase